MNDDDSDGKTKQMEFVTQNGEIENDDEEKENIEAPENPTNNEIVETDDKHRISKTLSNEGLGNYEVPKTEENFIVNETDVQSSSTDVEDLGSIVALPEINHSLESLNVALDPTPKKATNIFIKHLVEKMMRESGKFSTITETFQKKCNSNTFLSVRKVDKAFMEVFLSEICSLSNTSHAGFKQLIKEYLRESESVFVKMAPDFKQFVNLCLLDLVEDNQYNTLCLRRFLEWYFSLQSFVFIKDEWKRWIHDMKKPFDPEINIYINEALIQACKLGKHEMVFEFLNKGFHIYDTDFKSCDVTEEEKSGHRKRLLENRFNQRHLQIFQATSTPTFQIAKFFYVIEKYENQDNEKHRMLLKADVFSQTLHNLQIAMNLSVDEYDLAEYNNQLHKIINEGRNFLGDLISQCKTLEEAKLLLSHDYLLNHYALQYETTEWAYPRLDEACLSKHKELVTHDFSQRIFRENWLKSTKLKNVKSGVMKKIITGCILCPLYILFYLFGYLPMKSFGSLDCNGNLKFEAKLKQFPVLSDLFFHFSAPVNRCISDFSSHLLFILFILLTMINPNDEEKVLDINWYDALLVIWAVGFCVKSSRQAFHFLKNFFFSGAMYQSAHQKRSLQGVRDVYNVLQFLCSILILLGKMFKFVGFDCSFSLDSVSNYSWPFEKDNPQEYCDNSFLKTGYTLIGLGATVCILNLLHFFEFNSYFGPIILSMRQTAHDIMKVLTTFVVFLIAFSVGLHFSLKFSNMYCAGEYEKIMERQKYSDGEFFCTQSIVQTNLTGFVLEDNVNHFRDFQEAIKTCFWSLFDPGHPEVIGCTEGPPRHLGMFLWASYQVVNVVIMMNLLIALMNATIAGIQEDKITEWRFARTQVVFMTFFLYNHIIFQIWRTYFDHYKISVLPVPFNVPEMIINLILGIAKRLMMCKSGNVDNSEVPLKRLGEAGVIREVEEEQRKYIDLISELCDRYIQMKKRKEER